MIGNSQRFTPPSLRHRTRKSLIRPKSGIMSLDFDPTDPGERREQHLPPKSYADAAEEGLERTENGEIDEDAIKESPPRRSLQHARQVSQEPRPFGEVMDEVERGSVPSSPTLRHPRGMEGNETWDGDSRPQSYASAVTEMPAAPMSPGIVNGHGSGHDTSNPVGANGETFAGVGEDESPRSPLRKAQKRVPSRSSNVTPSRKAPPPPVKEKPSHLGSYDNGGDDSGQEPGKLIYETLRNKSGENLASIVPSDDFTLSLQQRANKPSNAENPTDHKRRNSELVSGRRVGAGWHQSAIRWAPLNVPLQRRLQTLLVLLHTLSIAGGLALFFLLCTIPVLWPVLVPYLLYVLLSRASTSGELSHRSEWLRSSKVWSLFGSYFPARLHRSQPLEPTRKYLFGYHPHGIISHGAFAAFATEALGFKQMFPGITNTLLTLDSNFRVPLYRDYALRMGLASVSRESCENILSHGGPNGEGMGRAITIVIGGARESLDAKPYTLRLVLKRRKGFVKLAIRTGADLVPVLAFGENDLYDQFDAAGHPYVHRAQLFVKKFMGFTVPLFHARGTYPPFPSAFP